MTSEIAADVTYDHAKDVLTVEFTREALEGLVALVNQNETRNEQGYRVTLAIEEHSAGRATLTARLDS